MVKKLVGLLLAVLVVQVQAASVIIDVERQDGNANSCLKQAIEKAASYKGKPVTIRLAPGVYSFDRSEATKRLYHVSNTTSENENPDPTKEIAVLLDGLKNVTIDGCGSTWLMTGEMTSLVLDHCENITIKNLSIDYSHPTQTEMEVIEDGKDYLITEVHPTSSYKIKNGKLQWQGDGWSFSGGIAQWYDPEKDLTWRTWSPMTGLKKAVELRPNRLYLEYEGEKPTVKTGTIIQMRDGIRDEVCGFINRCKNIQLEYVNFQYLGNFSLVCQYTENITINQAKFMPKPGSGRTNAGFADFLHVSGCKGKITVTNSQFAGAHDDPINVHGTHLKVTEYIDGKTLRIRFMHPQTYGFEAFSPKDEIELVNAETLLPILQARITKAELVNSREMVVQLDRTISPEIKQLPNVVIENVTWTPEVLIQGNTFSRIPTRGILISTRRPAIIENNTFYGTQMSAILVADDAMSWYESGPVHDLTIRRNRFLQCQGPVILIAPEYHRHEGSVHKNIRIEENIFESDQAGVLAIQARGTDGLTIRNNFFQMARKENVCDLKECENIQMEGNNRN